MRILVIGAAGREHALVWKLAQSRKVQKIFAAPGNAGMSDLAECLPLGADKPVELADFAESGRIDLTVVGPEAPLVHGIVDYFRSRGLKIFGPTKAAARLEGSKAFAKSVMEKYGVPTAAFQVFKDQEKALEYLEGVKAPIVVKADGLAGGKGVIVAQTKEEAAKAVNSILKDKIFPEAGEQVVIEECLTGEEASILALVDGTHFLLLEPSQDHKRVFDGDQGPNTGGMGAYSPVPMVDASTIAEIRRKIFEPVVRGMQQEGCPFQGILYAGLMLTPQGPKVLEFNVRLGDPEAQAILPRLKSDLVELILAAMDGRLDQASAEWDSRSCACVVLASAGYPGKYDVGRVITGLNQVSDLEDAWVFHAATRREGNRWVTSGGRILNVVGVGAGLEAALGKAYQAADLVRFEGKHFRRDIGSHALKQAGGVNESMRKR
ncbi:MAG: phosphoribosylamine--glycine ligase [Candidatus Omnitrophica bacterium]|nr:phosphoribosylamine--glycine ligase [Candidatus Omnitrophota bacterium]